VNSSIKLSFQPTRQFWEIPILFEDEHVLALDKPSGLGTLPSNQAKDTPALMPLLHAAIAEKKSWAVERGLLYLRASHRLDAEASGVLLLAKSKPVLLKLVDLFGADKPHKQFLVLIRGIPEEMTFSVEAKLAPHPVRAGVIRVDSRHGKRSGTRFEVLEKFTRYSLLRCELLTDRPHQVRVHLRHIGLAVVGDQIYGGKALFLSSLKPDYRPKSREPERPLIGRAAVHAERLTVEHPVSGELLRIDSPLPKDFKVGLKYLRQFAS